MFKCIFFSICSLSLRVFCLQYNLNKFHTKRRRKNATKKTYRENIDNQTHKYKIGKSFLIFFSPHFYFSISPHPGESMPEQRRTKKWNTSLRVIKVRFFGSLRNNASIKVFSFFGFSSLSLLTLSPCTILNECILKWFLFFFLFLSKKLKKKKLKIKYWFWLELLKIRSHELNDFIFIFFSLFFSNCLHNKR